MCSFTSNFCLYLTVVLLLVLTVVTKTFADEDLLKFLPWKSKCKLDTGREKLKFNEQCDQSKGMVCQTYGRNKDKSYCGCSQESTGSTSLSYDPQSEECRLKDGQFCFAGATDSLQFNSKCHERAECKMKPYLSETGQEKQKQSEDTTCICKEGYFHSEDSSTCVSPSKSASKSIATATHLLCGLTILFVLLNTE